MGKVQIVEMALKRRLVETYDQEENKVENWTLGKTIQELERQGVRGDFLALLDQLRELRNVLAHEFLATHAIINSLVGSKGNGFQGKCLEERSLR
jgi:hypothetical protein